MGSFERQIAAIKAQRRKWYDARASHYDEEWWANAQSLEEMKGFRQLVQVKAGDPVLDIATGTGIFLLELARAGAICHGIDQSPKMLEQLQRKLDKEGLQDRVREVRLGQADKLPYPARHFDWVTCLGLLEYYPAQYAKAVLGEVARVLKPQGACFMDISNPNSEEARGKEWRHNYNLAEFVQMTRHLGFRVVARNEVGDMLQYLFAKVDGRTPKI